MRKAELEFKRNEELLLSKLESESTFLEFKTGFEVAQAQSESATHQVAVAKATLDRAMEDLAKTSISSPLDGTISKLNSRSGERVVGTAMMTGTEIMIVSDLNAMEARIDVGEIDVVLIKPGQKTRLEVDAFHDRKFKGTVTEIANSSKDSGQGGGGGQSQEATKFEVRIRVDEKEELRPGMSVTADIETRYRTNVLTVPIQSVTTRLPKGAVDEKQKKAARKDEEDLPEKKPGSKKQDEANKPMEVVFVTGSDTVKMVKVKRGIGDDEYLEITEGLTEGQEAVSGTYKAINRELEEGKRIKRDNRPRSVREEKKSR
jgi:HlyD family secretion protein